MKRPKSLPDFASPPLNEVLLGIQFQKPVAYQQIYSRDVWALFQKDFPKVREMQSLDPTFETFGPQSNSQFQIDLTAGPTHDRFWFLQENEVELLQFQQDRLIHNWRKMLGEKNDYPRFGYMLNRFRGETKKLSNYFQASFGSSISVSQCEVSYINHIPRIKGREHPSFWFTVFADSDEHPDDLVTVFRRAIRIHDEPIGRLSIEIKTARNGQNEDIYVASFSVRGPPPKDSISGAMDFLRMGREVIVNEFAHSTTEIAHDIWGRKT